MVERQIKQEEPPHDVKQRKTRYDLLDTVIQVSRTAPHEISIRFASPETAEAMYRAMQAYLYPEHPKEPVGKWLPRPAK